MLKPVSLANTVTTMMVILYIVCATISFIAPDFLVGLAQSWVHTLNIGIIKAEAPMTFGSFLYGLLSLAVLTWIVSYTTAGLYRYFVRREEAVRFHRGYTVV